MANLETLTAQSLRRYELGRLRMALRVALPLLPITAVCLLEPAGREACACCASLLVGGSVWLRYRDRVGVESVTTGLLAGAIPLSAVLMLTSLEPGCAAAGLVSFCTGFSVIVGGAAGAVVAVRERSRAALAGHWALAACIALLAASLGCARLGVASVVGVAIGVLVGRASMRAMRAP